MYINPFVAGVLATLMVEMVAIFVYAITKSRKNGKK